MIPLGGLLGVPLRMHFAFPVLFGAALVCGDARAVLGALFALLWHEAGHVLAARLCGAEALARGRILKKEVFCYDAGTSTALYSRCLLEGQHAGARAHFRSAR